MLAVAVTAVAAVTVLGAVTGLILVGPSGSSHGLLTLSGTEIGPGQALMRVVLAAICMVSPVCGLRPVRAER